MPADDAGESLLIHTMEPRDVRDVQGNLRFVASAAEPVRGTTAPGRRVVGAFAAGGGGYEVFAVEGAADKPQKLYRHTTADFKTYSRARKVADLSPKVQWLGAKTMCRRDDTGEYLLVAWSRSKPGHGAHALVSDDGLVWRHLNGGEPVYTDHDAGGVFWSPQAKRYVFAQATYQRWKKIYPDNIGDNTRRVLSLRTSPDALHWTPKWDVGFAKPHRPAAERLAPDGQDPPELEFYWMQPFGYGDRTLGVMLLYAASPQAVNPNMQRGRPDFQPGKAPSKHGPQLGQEWFVAERPDDIKGWRRPYRETDAAPPGRALRHVPVVFGDRLVWLDHKGALGIPLGRIAGVRTWANAAFSTRKFVMPRRPLRLNAAAPWHGDKSDGQQRQAYIMVEALDERGKPIAGFEKDKCIFQDKDAQRLPLRWDSRDTTSLAGRTVALRFHFRDATIYGVHTGL